MKILISEKLSEHKYKTPEGYLVCVDSILARTGKQTYRRNELFHDGDDTEVEVDRTPEEVFSEATLASFENKPVTVEHPDEDVNINNYKEYAVGFVRDVKRGEVDGQDVILGTLVITDAQTIEEIENGEHTELSCGYDCDILDEDNPSQKNIRGNHVALCEQGRAGIAKIVDSVKDTTWCVELEHKGSTWTTYVEAPTRQEAINIVRKATKDPIRNMYEDSINDANRLPKKDRQFISNYLRMISTYTNRDVDIRDILRPLSGHGFNYTIEKVDGWIWKTGHYAHKDYYVSINGYDDRFLVTLYVDPNQDWKVKEVNAYFTDSVDDSINDSTFEIEVGGYDYDYPDAEKDARKYGLKLKRTGRIVKAGPNQGCEICILEGPRANLERMLKSEHMSEFIREIKDSVNDSTYKCEFKLNEDTMWTYVKADSPEDAKRELLDKFANAKNITVTGHDSVEDTINDEPTRGHMIVSYAEEYLRELGKNNSIGKYDKVIQGVKQLLQEGFLEGDALKKATRREVDRLLKQHGLDSAMKVMNMIKAKDSEIDNAKRTLSNKGINVAKVTGSEAAFYLWLENKEQSKQALDILKQIYKDVNVYTDDKTKMKKIRIIGAGTDTTKIKNERKQNEYTSSDEAVKEIESILNKLKSQGWKIIQAKNYRTYYAIDIQAKRKSEKEAHQVIREFYNNSIINTIADVRSNLKVYDLREGDGPNPWTKKLVGHGIKGHIAYKMK